MTRPIGTQEGGPAAVPLHIWPLEGGNTVKCYLHVVLLAEPPRGVALTGCLKASQKHAWSKGTKPSGMQAWEKALLCVFVRVVNSAGICGAFSLPVRQA